MDPEPDPAAGRDQFVGELNGARGDREDKGVEVDAVLQRWRLQILGPRPASVPPRLEIKAVVRQRLSLD